MNLVMQLVVVVPIAALLVGFVLVWGVWGGVGCWCLNCLDCLIKSVININRHVPI